MFKKGDQVQWMKVTQRGRSGSFNQRYGEIKSIDGERAIVYDYHSRIKVSIKLSNLLPQGGAGQVDQVFRAIAEQNGKSERNEEVR